jgi:hypothetical protein
VIKSIIIILIFISSAVSTQAGENFLLWVCDLKHHYEKKANTHQQWINKLNFEGLTNASFFKGDRSLITPFSSETQSNFRQSSRGWWFVDYEHDTNLKPTLSFNKNGYELKEPTAVVNNASTFTLSVCPPLIWNGEDIPKKYILQMGGKKFAYRNCKRTIIGKTTSGFMFIFVGTGTLMKVRNMIRQNVSSIKWLANLDGGSSSFLSVNKKVLIKNKTKVPSVISFKILKVEKF